jgi:hypothetical protein
MLKMNLSSEEWRVAAGETGSDRQDLGESAQPATPVPATVPSAERVVSAELSSRDREQDEAISLPQAAPVDALTGRDAIPEFPATPLEATSPPPAAVALEAALDPAPDPAASVIGAVRGALFTEITEHPGIFLLTAEAEIDRASLLGGLARELRAAGHFVSIVPGDDLTVRDLLFDLSLKAGIQPLPSDSLEPWLERFHAAARAAYVRRSLFIVLIDDAERLADAVMEHFAALLFQAPGKPSSLRLLLTGHVPVERLADPQFSAARQAMVSQRHLRRLSNGTIAAEVIPLAPPPAPGETATSAKPRRTGRLWIVGAAAAAAIVAVLWLRPDIVASGIVTSGIGASGIGASGIVTSGPAPAPTIQSAAAPLVIPLPSSVPDVPGVPARTADETASAAPVEVTVSASPAVEPSPDETSQPTAAIVEPALPIAEASPPAEAAATPTITGAPLADEASAMSTVTDADSPADLTSPIVLAEIKPEAGPMLADASPAAEATTTPTAAVPSVTPDDTVRSGTKVVAAAVTPPPPDAAAAAPATRLPADAVAALIRRGDEFLAIKDIAAARLFYERAAAAGSGHAATLAGKTYDPRYLKETGARGLSPNPAKAAEWYRKAADLGDADAATWLQGLPPSP